MAFFYGGWERRIRPRSRSDRGVDQARSPTAHFFYVASVFTFLAARLMISKEGIAVASQTRTRTFKSSVARALPPPSMPCVAVFGAHRCHADPFRPKHTPHFSLPHPTTSCLLLAVGVAVVCCCLFLSTASAFSPFTSTSAHTPHSSFISSWRKWQQRRLTKRLPTASSRSTPKRRAPRTPWR